MLSGIVIVVVPIVLTLGIIRKYRERKWGTFKSKKSLAGKTFMITGANSGIGMETTRGLVERNAKVIMACRDVNSAKKAIADIRKTTSNGEMVNFIHKWISRKLELNSNTVGIDYILCCRSHCTSTFSL